MLDAPFDSAQLLTLASAELILLLVESEDIRTLVKSRAQRTDREQHQENRGLKQRSVTVLS